MPFGQICLGLWMESGNEQQCGSEVALNGPSGVHRSHGRNRWRVRSVGKWQSASRHHQQMCIVKFLGAAASFVASDVMLAAVPSAVGSLGQRGGLVGPTFQPSRDFGIISHSAVIWL